MFGEDKGCLDDSFFLLSDSLVLDYFVCPSTLIIKTNQSSVRLEGNKIPAVVCVELHPHSYFLNFYYEALYLAHDQIFILGS